MSPVSVKVSFGPSSARQSPVNRTHEAAAEQRRLALGRARQACQPFTLPNYAKRTAASEGSATGDGARSKSARRET